MTLTAEQQRLEDHRLFKANWRKWGPYLSERAWGTVREDYSPAGDAWHYFPHSHAPSRAYRWNEDGLCGISDRSQYICLALALWNGKDDILKERLFGLTGPQGNHGEDVKEYYFYLDNTPTHSYMRMLYKYPQAPFPYQQLVNENYQRGFHDFEYELIDTGIFDENRYFDVQVEYAKADDDDILMRISVTNRADEAAECHILPTLWFRNTWSWGYPHGPMKDVNGKPIVASYQETDAHVVAEVLHPAMGIHYLYARSSKDKDLPEMLFTDNETNVAWLYQQKNENPYVKDAFHRYIIQKEEGAVNPAKSGTKAAAYYHAEIPAGETMTYCVRLCPGMEDAPFKDFDDIFATRIAEADEFYEALHNPELSDNEKKIQRQAFAGMLWSKQLYYYDVPQWLDGDPGTVPPPEFRKSGRNSEWVHLNNFDVISMPDKWEYPWYATWDLAFHCIALVLVDADFAKRQMTLVTREWYMHPNGQLPAYEWNFSDVNPPVHAWATWRIYKIEEKQRGKGDREFLEGIFHKLLLNFTWWVNRKDADGNNIFQGGFLGMDNISVFDRSRDLPTGGHIDQSDGTAWMAFYCLEMMRIALELAKENPVYQDSATKFFEHFLRITFAMNNKSVALWDDEDGFFYDVLHLPDGTVTPLKVRSMVGLLPLLAVETLEPKLMEELPEFDRRAHWFLNHLPHFGDHIASIDITGESKRRLMTNLTREQLVRVLGYMLDENEFLSPYGIRSLSKIHQEHPYELEVEGQTYTVRYLPAESDNGMFGGNSNWRGPIWFPINYLIIEALQKFHHYYGDDLQVAFPTGSGNLMTLDKVAAEISRRMISLFIPDETTGARPIYGGLAHFRDDPHWREHILFYEYFNGDDGAGLGASHQTGWTGLIAKLIQQSGGAPDGPDGDE